MCEESRSTRPKSSARKHSESEKNGNVLALVLVSSSEVFQEAVVSAALPVYKVAREAIIIIGREVTVPVPDQSSSYQPKRMSLS